jgi:hypothetical protein
MRRAVQRTARLVVALLVAGCEAAGPGGDADGGGRDGGERRDAEQPDRDGGRVTTDRDAAADSSIDPGPATRTVDEWEELFRDAWESERDEYLALCRSADSWDFYNASYYVDGLAQIAEATGKQEYVAAAIECADAMIASARPSTELGAEAFNDDYLGWSSYQNGSTGQEEQLYEAYMWRHVAELLRVIDRDAGFRAENEDAYRRILAFTERNIFDKWYGRGGGPTAYVYAIVTHMASHWAWICLDLVLLSDDASIVDRCTTVVEHIDHVGVPGVPENGGLRGQFVADRFAPESYFFDMWWGSTERPGQDVSHGNAVVAYIVEGAEHGTYWQHEDLTRLAGTMKFIWTDADACAEFVDGTGTDNCWFSDGWDRLGRVDGEIQYRLERHEVGRGGQLYGTGALNAAKLGLR